MKYTVKLLEADVINKDNRSYSKKVIEEINEQLNSNTVRIYNNSFGDIIGQTIKYSSRIIEADTLFIDVTLKKPVNAEFVNLLFKNNTNSYYNDSNIVSQNSQNKLEIE